MYVAAIERWMGHTLRRFYMRSNSLAVEMDGYSLDRIGISTEAILVSYV